MWANIYLYVFVAAGLLALAGRLAVRYARAQRRIRQVRDQGDEVEDASWSAPVSTIAVAVAAVAAGVVSGDPAAVEGPEMALFVGVALAVWGLVFAFLRVAGLLFLLAVVFTAMATVVVAPVWNPVDGERELVTIHVAYSNGERLSLELDTPEAMKPPAGPRFFSVPGNTLRAYVETAEVDPRLFWVPGRQYARLGAIRGVQRRNLDNGVEEELLDGTGFRLQRAVAELVEAQAGDLGERLGLLRRSVASAVPERVVTGIRLPLYVTEEGDARFR